MGLTLITGATSDIGRQISATLEEAGHTLLLTDIDEGALNEVKNGLKTPHKHRVLALDLSEVETAEKTFTEYILSNKIEVSDVVFAAGIFTVKPVKFVDYAYFRKSFDVAVFSIFSMIKCLTSKKINADNLRHIVLISSISTKIGTKGYSVYGAVKGAMLGLLKSLAVELAPRVRVNAIPPGGIRTRTTNFIYESINETNPRYLLGEGEKTDIAALVEFLLSDKSRWITGQEFVVDGGFTSN